MGWSEPWWLLALGLIPLILIGYRRPSAGDGDEVTGGVSRGPTALGRLAWLRTGAIAATVLALAGTSILMPANRRYLAVLIDVSASLERAEVERARTAALQVIRSMTPADRVAVASFAGQPRTITRPVAPVEAALILEAAELAAAEPDRTDLQAAIRLGLQLLVDYRGNRSLLLFSDGRPTAGGTATAVLTGAGDVPIGVVPIGRAGGGFWSDGLELPVAAPAGVPVLAQWKVASDRDRSVAVGVSLDGLEIVWSTVDVPAGRSIIPLNLGPLVPGVHRIEVRGEAPGETGQVLADSGGILRVRGPMRILVVDEEIPNQSPGSAVRRALVVQGMAVEEAGPDELPEKAQELFSYAAIILDNIPAAFLTAGQQQALREYAAGGGGLLFIGGDSSLGRGEYYDTPLEEILPVMTDTRRRLRFTRTNVLFVLDHSGSMSEEVGGVTKREAAMRGVAAAIEELGPQDEAAILAFDTSPTWVLPFTPVTEREEILGSLSGIKEGGGTDMATALREAARGLRGRGPVRSHVMILSDGLTFNDDFKSLSRDFRNMGATVTTIGIGGQINEPLLREIAETGEGRFYRAELAQVPRVIWKETMRVTKDLIQEGDFAASLQTSADFLAGLTPLPRIKGYLRTKAKDLATVYMTIGGENEPLLAAWQYGGGRVAIFTSDSGSRWLSGWSGRSVFNRLWSQVTRFVARDEIDEGLRLRVVTEAGTAKVGVEAVGPDRRLRSGLHLIGRLSGGEGHSFPLNETSPGCYEAVVPLSGAGLQTIEIREAQGPGWTVGGVWVPVGTEMQFRGPDRDLLGRICTETGGGMHTLTTVAPPPKGWSFTILPMERYLIVAALCLFLVELGLRSTALGQAATARSALVAWWQGRKEVLARMRAAVDPHMEAGRGSAREARRYLAEQGRRRGAQK